MAKALFNKKKILFTKKMILNLCKKLVKWYIWNTALYGADSRVEISCKVVKCGAE